MVTRIFVINFGSTSSKFAVYENEMQVASVSFEHSRGELNTYDSINAQLPMRREITERFLKEKKYELTDFSAIVARAGGTAPINGVYEINERMRDKLLNRSKVKHVANLCAVVAYDMAKPKGIPCYVSSFTEDSMLPITKISGLPEIRRSNEGHMENWYAVARKACAAINKKYEESCLIVAHLGGGTTAGLHQFGKITDVVGDTEGAFGPERSGGLPLSSVLDLLASGKYTTKELLQLMRGKGGLYAYTGTSDARVIEGHINNGDKDLKTVYRAMALQNAKAIATLAVTAHGQVDCIALSGGLANSKLFMGWMEELLSFIAPVKIFPGEFEMDAMALSVLPVLQGTEHANIYTEEIDEE